MPNRNNRRPIDVTATEILATYVADHEDRLLDSIVTVAALVARADGWVQSVERGRLLDFIGGSALQSVFSRDEITEAFDRRIRELAEPEGSAAALRQLRDHAETLPRHLVADAAEQVAAADYYLDPREEVALRRIRTSLGLSSAPDPR